MMVFWWLDGYDIGEWCWSQFVISILLGNDVDHSVSWVDLNVDRALTLHSPSLAQSPFSVDPTGSFTDIDGAQFLFLFFLIS